MSLTPLPTAPSRSDPVTFRSRMDAFLAAMVTLATELNAFLLEVTGLKDAAETAASNAGTSATNASASAAAAAASAASALNSPGTNGTSTTSLTVGLGSKTFTTQTGKSWVPGQRVMLPRTSDPAGTWMSGTLTAYNSGTGATTLLVTNYAGSGTFTDWTVALGSAPVGIVMPTNPITSGSAVTAAVNVDNLLDANNIPMTAPTSKAVGDIFQAQVVNDRTGCTIDFGTDKAWGKTQGVIPLPPNGRVKLKWTGSTYGWVQA